VRRWIAEGKLRATRTGDGWLVDPASLDGHPDGHADGRVDAGTAAADRAADHAATDGQPAMVELVRLVGRLQEENRVMAGRIGRLEAQLQQAHAALPAPDMPQDAPGRDSGAPAAEPTHGPSEGRRRPWWRRWSG
jgi:hypothetical protein